MWMEEVANEQTDMESKSIAHLGECVREILFFLRSQINSTTKIKFTREGEN